MKTIAKLLFVSLLFVSCEKDYVYVRKIRIKGQIENSKASSQFSKAPSGELSLANASYVLIFYGKEYELVDVNSTGSFSARVPLGSASCLCFLTKNYQFIGSLFVGGSYLLPLVGIDKDLNEIDLSTLTLSGTRVIPSNDPIGEEIKLSVDEQKFMQQIDSYYEALSENLDMDRNGKPDILEGKHIDLHESNSFDGGTWDASNTISVFAKDRINVSNGIFMEAPNKLINNTSNATAENATLTGPSIMPLPDIYNSGNSYINNENFKVNFARRSAQQSNINPPFTSGEYTLNIDSKQLKFNYSRVDMFNYLIMPVPVLVINSAGQLTSLKTSFKFLDGSVIEPRNLISSGIDISLSGGDSNNMRMLAEIRTSPNIKFEKNYSFYNHEFEEPVSFSSITEINIRYFDIIGNSFNVRWMKKI